MSLVTPGGKKVERSWRLADWEPRPTLPNFKLRLQMSLVYLGGKKRHAAAWILEG